MDYKNNTSSGEQKNLGVVCDVYSCVYHDRKSACTAEQIKVGPEYANSTAETVCSTFKPRSGR